MKLLFLCALVAVAVQQPLVKSPNVLEWEMFKIEYNKDYESVKEELKRKNIFLKNLKNIKDHNSKYERGLVSFKLGINKYTDLTESETAVTRKGYQKISEDNLVRELYVDPSSLSLPMSIDWRMKGAVTPVKDQEQCGSCWAFSATGCLEGQNFLKHGKLVSLSEQNLIDCSKPEKTHGCHGGDLFAAYEYVKKNNGIDTEISYPYEAKDDVCHYKPKNKGATVTDYVKIPLSDEKQLQIAVATKGPISVAIDAHGDAFQQYTSGVYKNTSCTTTKLDHAVLVVGYGTTSDGEEYWLVKNSWGDTWGMEGYIMMARNKNNMCGIASHASYPIA